MDYDYTGARVKKDGPFGLTIYPFPGYEIGSDGVKIKYIKLGNEILAAKKSTGEKLFYHNDHLGGINVITNLAAERAQLTEYDPWGKISRKEGDADPGKRFTGQEFDPEIDLYYYGGRYYDQDLGRFVSPDPFIQEPEEPQNLNRYSYVMNNPVNYIDPSGYGFWSIFLRIFTIIIGGGDQGISAVDPAVANASPSGSDNPGTGNSAGGQGGVSENIISGYGGTNRLQMLGGTPAAPKTPDMGLRLEATDELLKNNPSTNPDIELRREATGQIKVSSADPRSTARPGLPVGFQPIEGPRTGSVGSGQSQGGGNSSHSSQIQGFRQAPHSLAIMSIGDFDINVLDVLGLGIGAGTLRAIQSGITTIEKIIESSRLISQSARLIQLERAGGFSAAKQLFEQLNVNAAKLIEVPGKGIVRAGELPGGLKVNVRPFSTEGRPTLEIIRPGQARVKVRFGD